MRRISRFALFATFVFLATGVLDAQARQSSGYSQKAFDPGTLNPQAPPETAVFGKLAGVWEARQVKRKRDGTWSPDTTHAQWRWYYILDGHAIQDDWLNKGTDDDSGWKVVGTNIRIYNPDEKQWHMAWIDKTVRRLATFTAKQEGDAVIMTGHNAQGRLVRNTFSNISKQTFDWAHEWTQDDGKTWFPVAKIYCKRRRGGKSQ